MIYLIIYLTGYILAYIMLRKTEFSDRDWSDIILSAVLSIFSYIIPVSLVVIKIWEKIEEILDNHKPPKWL